MPEVKNKIVINIKNLQKSFGKEKILNDINLELFEEENLVVLGKSGSGKSVLIKCIVGLLPSDRGEIVVFDQDIRKLDQKGLNDIRKRIGFLFQSGALYDSMSVRQNMEFPLSRVRKNLSKTEREEKILEVLEIED